MIYQTFNILDIWMQVVKVLTKLTREKPIMEYLPFQLLVVCRQGFFEVLVKVFFCYRSLSSG